MDPLTIFFERGPVAGIVAGLLWALRWAIQRGDAAQAAQILNGEKTAVALHASTKAVEDVTRILNDFKQAEAIRQASRGTDLVAIAKRIGGEQG